jgi:hypothetical protein
MQVKNQWENAKLIMLNNKASIDNGNRFFYSISNKTKVILIYSCYMHVLETVIIIVIDMEFSRTFYKYSI